eukprot:scaffold7.g3603.t1
MLRRLAQRSGRSWIAAARLLHGDAAAPAAPKPTELKKMKDSFLDGTSSSYLEELEERYRVDPQSVDKTWVSFFKSLDMGVTPEQVAEAYDAFEKGQVASPLAAAAVSNQTIQESMRLLLLVRAYQVQGHFAASLDPLGLDERKTPEALDPAFYGFSERDLDREFFLGGSWNMEGFMAENRPVRTLREILTRLKETYCGSIGYEYMHIPDRERCNWLRARIETLEPPQYSVQKKLNILDRLTWSEMFESFLANKYTAAKRFGLEGCEALIPGMKALIDHAADMGAESVVIGMPHRGRLNVLANVMRKPMEQVFSEFAGRKPHKGVEGDTYTGSGDVKYHLGTSYDRPTLSGKRIHLSLLANPSHLEAVDTVCLGKARARHRPLPLLLPPRSLALRRRPRWPALSTSRAMLPRPRTASGRASLVRAKQYYSDDFTRRANIPILMHGDGAFAGQARGRGSGIVYETLDMSNLPDYTVGGTIHLIVNNQARDGRSGVLSHAFAVAFTTDPRKSRSSPYCTDVAKALNAPVFHVNGDDAEAVVRVCELAAEWRQTWGSDIVIDLAIKRHKNPHVLYAEKLVAEGSVTKEQVRQISDAVQQKLHDAFEEAKSEGFMSPHQHSRIRNTGVPMDLLKLDSAALRSLARVYQNRREMVEGKLGVDWGMAEALAFGTLLAEGNHVRLSGQDVERGTFSHRHAVVHDQRTGDKYTPLGHLHRQFRKPLVVFSPKNLLRHPQAKSMLEEFDEMPEDPNILGVRFRRVIMDEGSTDRSPNPPPEPSFKRLVFCTGKVYYELAAERAKQGKNDAVAVVRVEQLAPFPYDLVHAQEQADLVSAALDV